MPLYTFRCPEAHESERLAARQVEVISCACGLPARRAEVNRIGVVGFAEVPRHERNYRQSYTEYVEAVSEVGDAYDAARRNGDPVTPPDYVGMAMARTESRAD